MCKDKEGNILRERENSGLLRCRGHGREMVGLSLKGWIWAPSSSTLDATRKRSYPAANGESEGLSRGNMVKPMFWNNDCASDEDGIGEGGKARGNQSGLDR